MADAENVPPRVSEHLARLQALWLELQHSHDPEERRTLELRIREEADAYKRMTDPAFKPDKS